MNNPVLQAISDRRSIREYLPKQISKEQLDALLKAALEAPTGMNRQPWHFTVVQDQVLIDDMNVEINKRLNREEGDIYHGAPTVIFISGDPGSEVDCGIAVQTLALAAHSMGLGSVILGMPNIAFEGDRREEFEKRLHFPTTHSHKVSISIGYPASSKEAHPIEDGRITCIL